MCLAMRFTVFDERGVLWTTLTACRSSRRRMRGHPSNLFPRIQPRHSRNDFKLSFSFFATLATQYVRHGFDTLLRDMGDYCIAAATPEPDRPCATPGRHPNARYSTINHKPFTTGRDPHPQKCRQWQSHQTKPDGRAESQNSRNRTKHWRRDRHGTGTSRRCRESS